METARSVISQINHTGLEGVFNLKLQWTPESATPTRPADGAVTEGPSIFTAIQEQLGLRLHAEKQPVEVLVIGRAEKPSHAAGGGSRPTWEISRSAALQAISDQDLATLRDMKVRGARLRST